MNEVEIPLKLGGIGAIKAELRDLKGQIANATDAESMAKLAMRAGELKDQLQDANQAVNTFSTGSKFEAVGNSIGGIKDSLMSLDFAEAAEKAKGFAIVMGTIKPDDISKAFKGLTSTLGSIGKAFMSLGQTLLANPIYLIAAVIAGIIAITIMLADKLGYLSQAAEAAGIVFDALIEMIKDFGESIGIAAAQSEEYVAMQEANTEANKEVEKSTADVMMVVNEVGTAFDLAKEGVISKKEALDTYNDKLGDTFGAATTLAEAEKLYVSKTEAYIQATMARARAEVFAKKAAEADAKAITAKTQDQTTSADKLTSWMKKNRVATEVFGGVYKEIDKRVGELGDSIEKKQVKRVGEQEKRQKKISEMYQKEATSALKNALELEKTNEITVKSDHKKTVKHKDNSAQRIREAEAEAKRLHDIEVKANEDRIKREDTQFDMMNKLTMTQQAYEKQLLDEEYDKKNEVAKGNAELEALLLIQQQKDKDAITAKYKSEEDKKIQEEADKKAAALKASNDLAFELTATEQEKDMLALEEKFKAEQLILGENDAAKLALANKFEEDKKNIENKYALERIENARKERDAKIALAEQIATGVSDVGAMLIKDQKKLEKFNKASALVQIGIDTAKAISALVAASQSNPFNGLTAGAAGIAQFASGIIQIVTNVAKAKQILTSGGTPSSGGGGGGGESSGGGESVAQQVPQAAQLFGAANTGNVMSAGGTASDSSMTVTAVVSETQITNVQHKINNIKKNAEL